MPPGLLGLVQVSTTLPVFAGREEGRLLISFFLLELSIAFVLTFVPHSIVSARLCSLSILILFLDMDGLLAASQAAAALAAEGAGGQYPPSGQAPASPARIVPASPVPPPTAPAPLPPVVPSPAPSQPPSRLLATAAPNGEPRGSGGGAGPSAGRHTSGRGGLFFARDRPLPPPDVPIQKINVFTNKDLELTVKDRRRLRTGVAFAINQILRSTAYFCTRHEDRQRTAVVYHEERVPRLAMCESVWGACAVLSRGLRHRRNRQRRKTAGSAAEIAATAAAATSAAAPAAGTGDSATETVGGGGDNDAPSAREQQLAFFSQLEK